MRRLSTAVQWDARLQYRHGFYYAVAFIVLLWVFLASQRPPVDFGRLLPALVAGNLLLNTFYFVGGLVLLEKGEGTLEAQVVTPLTTGEYLASKVITLTILSMAENVLIVGLLYGFGFGALPLLAGITAASTIYVLLGFVAVARYDSINEYLMPSLVYSTVLNLPMLLYLGQWDHPLVYLHPLQAPLLLMEAAFRDVESWRVAYGALYSALWMGVAYVASHRAFQRFVVAREGVR